MKIFNENELVNWMKLTRVPKLGPKKIKDLLEIYKNIDNIVLTSSEELIRTRLFNQDMMKEWEKLKKASNENFYKVIHECKENKIQIVAFFDSEYPDSLRRIPYPPLTLFLKGDTFLLKTLKVAIVGTRKANEEAKKWAFEKARIFAENDITVVSGGAIGIDASAHKGTLELSKGKTICVLGSGFFKMYPKENISLFEEIGKRGLLVSEHLPNFPGSRISLIQRNRITSGLSNVIIVVASGTHGGAMVQIKIAFEQRIPIFCPKLSLNLEPNEGLRQVIDEWGGKETDDVYEIIALLNRNEKTRMKNQVTLSQFA